MRWSLRRARRRLSVLIHLSLTLVALLLVAACGPSATGYAAPPPPDPNGAILLATGPANPGQCCDDVYRLGLAGGATVWDAPLADAGATFFTADTVYEVIGQSNSLPTGITPAAVEARNAGDGKVRWHKTLSSNFIHGLAASAGAIFVQTGTTDYSGPLQSPRIIALATDTGKILWSTPYEGSASATDKSVLYTFTTEQSDNGSPPLPALAGLDQATGKPLWHVAIPGLANGQESLVVADGVAYVLTANNMPVDKKSPPPGTLTAIRGSDGAVLWHIPAPGVGASGSLVPAGDTLYFGYEDGGGTVNGAVAALSASDGHVLWRAKSQAHGPPALTSDGTTVYAVSNNASTTVFQQTAFTPRLEAYDAHSGKALSVPTQPELKRQADLTAMMPPVLIGGVLYAAGNALTSPVAPEYATVVVAINPATGRVIWERDLKDATPDVFFLKP